LSKKADKNDNSYGTGYVIEEFVGTKLSALGEQYKVVHDISKGKGWENIDHVVVGPTGIFVIESKANRNKMFYYKNNERKISQLAEKFIKQAARNACWVRNEVKEYLKNDEFIHGIVVRPLNEDKKMGTYCANRVCIMDGDSVYQHIKKFSGRLSFEDIDKIYKHLCRLKRNNDKANQTTVQRIISILI
jgi:hypothetical protein